MKNSWSRIVQAYGELQPSAQYTNLGLSSFCDPTRPKAHYPKLKGKGAEVKGLVGPLSMVWNNVMDSSKAEHKMIQAMLGYKPKIQTIIDDHGQELFLPGAEVLVLQNTAHDFLTVYTDLGHLADSQNTLLWNMTPKFHFLWHLAHRAQYLCPRRGACLIDEDYVGQISTVAQACSAGTQLHQIPGKLTEKVRWGKGLQ